MRTKTVKLKGRRVIRMWEHAYWGDNIEWFHFEDRTLVGWLPIRPKKGDYVLDKMTSGNVAVFKVVSVELQRDPRDMFYATVKDMGYLERSTKE